MLDTDTKRRIDSARDILVGKVPDPKSQVEQITIALIYKFMDYMDAESEELGGKRKFFTGDYARGYHRPAQHRNRQSARDSRSEIDRGDRIGQADRPVRSTSRMWP